MKTVKGVNIRSELVAGFPESELETKAVVLGEKKLEPAINGGVSVGVVTTILLGLIVLQEQQFPDFLSPVVENWLYFIISVLAPVAAAVFIRGKVWSPASVQEVLNAALEEAKRVNNANKK